MDRDFCGWHANSAIAQVMPNYTRISVANGCIPNSNPLPGKTRSRRNFFVLDFLLFDQIYTKNLPLIHPASFDTFYRTTLFPEANRGRKTDMWLVGLIFPRFERASQRSI